MNQKLLLIQRRNADEWHCRGRFVLEVTMDEIATDGIRGV
jgi:hypothetical protein